MVLREEPADEEITPELVGLINNAWAVGLQEISSEVGKLAWTLAGDVAGDDSALRLRVNELLGYASAAVILMRATQPPHMLKQELLLTLMRDVTRRGPPT